METGKKQAGSQQPDPGDGEALGNGKANHKREVFYREIPLCKCFFLPVNLIIYQIVSQRGRALILNIWSSESLRRSER